MFITEQEILDTPHALMHTCQYFDEKEGAIKDFFSANSQRKFSFFGCGSSYMLAKSAAALFQSLPNTSACAVPAGDYIVNPKAWQETVRGSIVVTLSRSGRTTEIVRAVTHIKDALNCPVVSVSMADNNDIAPMSDLNIIMNWCYDKSVCQTRTVTNLYAATLLLAASYSKNEKIAKSVRTTCELNSDFQVKNRSVLESMAELPWNNIVVLSDGPVCGIAEEAALAFTEICMLTGRYFHVLDYRHGPIVISKPDTLTLILLQPEEEALQGGLVHDVISHGGPVITVSEHANNLYGASVHIQIEGISEFAAWGIPFIYIAQMLALFKAVVLGENPDAPKGLDPYIQLKHIMEDNKA